MRRPWFVILALIGALVLAACGVAPVAESPTAEPKPTERPTSTPRPKPTVRPTREPTKEPTEEPTEEPTKEPTEEPTSDSGSLVTRKIDMSSLQTYNYKSGIFSIDVPESWTADDRGSATEVLVRFTDATQNGVVLVDLFERDTQTQDELISLLNSYLDGEYTKQPNFSRDDPKPQADGSVLVVWGYDVELNGKTVRLLGNSFIEQRDKLVSVLTLAVPDEQFDTLRPQIHTLLNSYKIDNSVSVAGESNPTPDSGSTGKLKEVQIGDLETYSYKTDLFSIDVPNNWTLKDNSKSGEAIVLWTDPTENGLIVVDLFQEDKQQSSDELVELLRNFLNKSFKAQPDFNMNDPKEQSDGSQLIVWSYTANASGGVSGKLLGNSFIEQRGNKISILTTAVPDDQFATLKPQTNKIINSYTINPDADLP